MKELTYEEAKELAAKGAKVYEARYDGEVWSAGRMVEVGDVIGYYATREAAEKACRDYELCDFDPKHLQTSVEELDGDYFA